MIKVGTVGTIDVGGSDRSGDRPTLTGQPDKNKISQGK
jgi:hypothetical protein